MKLYVKVIAILALPLLFVVAYAVCPIQLPPPGWKLSKLDLRASPNPSQEGGTDSVEPCKITLPLEGTEEAEAEAEAVAPDTIPQRILFLGDSMAEGLVRRMADYAEENGHFLSRVVWYNSTTKSWASSDTLQFFIRKYQPTFLMICMGGNEQFVKDVHVREEYVHKIIGTFGDTPFVWIGVPAWKEDTGLNSLIQKCVGEERFFDSRELTLKRGSDRVHPTFAAASMWMDSIAAWMQDRYPIQMHRPGKKATHKYPLHLLQPDS